MESKILSVRELRRYQKQIEIDSIGLHGQEIIKQARILVVGAGGKGIAVLENLITAGIGFIGICDDSIVSEDDFCKQYLFGDNELGKQKAIVSKQHLQSRNSFVSIKVHNIKLSSENYRQILENYDVVIDATNDLNTHVLLANVSNALKKPCIAGEIIESTIRVALLNGQEKRWIEDNFVNRSLIQAKESDLPLPLIISYSVIGAILAIESIKIILNKESQLYEQLLIINLSGYSVTYQKLS